MQPSSHPPAAPTLASASPLGFRIDPVVVTVAGLVLGAAGPIAAAAVSAAGVVGLAALRRQMRGWTLIAAGLALAVGWARASWLLAEHAERHEAGRALVGASSRCAAAGRVTSSPVLVGDGLRFDAALSNLDCGAGVDARLWPARLYVPSRGAAAAFAAEAAALARGDEFQLVAELGPTSEFRNFDLADPRPGAARRRVVLSGAALSLEIGDRGGGVPAWIDRARSHVRERIVDTFAAPVSGMARALVLGESDLAPEDEAAFQRSGLSHLLAVSGTHLILAVMALVRGLEALLRRWTWLASRGDVRRTAALLGLCMGPAYADFAGGSGSAWRAAYMLCAVLGVRALGRHVFASRVIAVSLGMGWLADGLVVFDTSFALSIAATLGLLAMSHRFEESSVARATAITQPRRPNLTRLLTAVSHATLTTVAATLPCVPILLSIAPGLSLASVAANLLAAPLGEAIALPLCLAHALCAPLPALERGIALVASGALAVIRSVAHASASIHWLYFEVPPPTDWHFACIVAGSTAWLSATGRPWRATSAPPPSASGHASLRASAPSRAASNPPRPRLGPTPPLVCASTSAGATAPAPGIGAGARALVATVAALLVIEAATRWPHSAACGRASHRLRVTALDVGQGDATLVDLPDGRLLLIDGGGFVGVPIDPGERVILPTLRARRRDRIDVVVLTHPHPDHYGGLASVIEHAQVGEFWFGGGETARSHSAHGRLLELVRARGIPVRMARDLCAALPRDLGGLRVLHPCPDVMREQAANDNSLVLRLSHGAHAALLAGDAEGWAEQRLLATHPRELAADFLKVGHHGSRTSSDPDFLAHVAPRWASISCGLRNRFGHPHPETLSHLKEAGTRPLRLDLEGAVQWQSDGTTQSARTFIAGQIAQ